MPNHWRRDPGTIHTSFTFVLSTRTMKQATTSSTPRQSLSAAKTAKGKSWARSI